MSEFKANIVHVLYAFHTLHILIINCKPLNTLNKNKCITNINLLHVPAMGCPPHRVFQIKGIQSQDPSLGMHRPH